MSGRVLTRVKIDSKVARPRRSFCVLHQQELNYAGHNNPANYYAGYMFVLQAGAQKEKTFLSSSVHREL